MKRLQVQGNLPRFRALFWAKCLHCCESRATAALHQIAAAPPTLGDPHLEKHLMSH